MKVFFTDETNISRNPNQGFFIYGGIVVDEAELRPLSVGLLSIKRDLGIPKERPIKWPNENWNRTGQLDPALHAQAKDRVLTLFTGSTARIVVCLSPQDFYHVRRFAGFVVRESINEERQKRTQEWALNSALLKFNMYLGETGCLGIVMADGFAQNMKAHLGAHCFGIFPSGTSTHRFDNVVYPVVQLDNEYSQLHQVNDVVLGAISYSLTELSENFLPRLADHFWTADPNNKRRILGRGFSVYPQHPRFPQLQSDIQLVREKFIRRLQ